MNDVILKRTVEEVEFYKYPKIYRIKEGIYYEIWHNRNKLDNRQAA